MNSPEHLNWVPALSVSEIGRGDIKGLRVGGYDLAIYQIDNGEYFATEGICTHALAFLSEGWLDGEVVECPLHGGCFNVRTGKGLGAPITRDLVTFAVRVVDGMVEVALPSASRSA